MIAFLDLIDKEEDKQKFVKLYKQYLPLATFIVRKKINNHEEIEECVQDVFLYIARNINRIEEVDSPKTKCYVSTVAEGKAVDRYRSFAKLTSSEEALFNEEIADEDFDDFECTELKMVIDSLDTQYKNFLYLTYIFGYTSKEIAQMYKMSDTNVRKKIQFAKNEVKRKIQNWN